VSGDPLADGAASGAAASEGPAVPERVGRPDPILSVRDVHRSFGGVRAVSVDELQVARGSVVALIGPNGAGKTTFFNVLTGFERADGGSWTFGGDDLSGRSAYAVARRGMVRTFQTARVFPRLTVLDNVRLAAPDQRGERLRNAVFRRRWRAQEEALGERAGELVRWVGLGDKRDDLAGTLSGGQRKLLELARAVMASPGLLMLDEPMAGVNPALRQTLLDRIRELPGQGITVLFVEHDMDVVSAISDVVVCMAEGRVIARGTAGEVAADERVVHAYLGGSDGDLRDMDLIGTAPLDPPPDDAGSGPGEQGDDDGPDPGRRS
jgi:neutral amino acid transport system ATP-binding protein